MGACFSLGVQNFSLSSRASITTLGPQLLPPTLTVAVVLEDSQAVVVMLLMLLGNTLVCVSDAGPPYLICVLS